MNKNQKVLSVYTKYDGFNKYNTKSIAGEEGIDRRSISYLKTIMNLCSEEEFDIVKEAIKNNAFIVTKNGERTKSLECLVKLLKLGDVVVKAENDPGMLLYLLSCNGKTKIGVAKSITNRLKLLQTGNPYPLVLIGEYKQSSEKDARIKEGYLHNKYADKCVYGEWFELEKNDLKDIEQYLKEDNDK